jgi:hypothetical protein
VDDGEAPWRSTLHAAILEPSALTAPRILMLPDGDRWHLPSAVLPERAWIPLCGPIIAAVREQLGVETVVLRAADGRIDRDQHEIDALYLVEPVSTGWTPPATARWVGAAELAELPLAIPAQRSVLRDALLDLGAPTTALGSRPWSRRGWFASVARWIGEQVDRVGLTMTGPLVHRSNWSISTVIRVPTSAGDYFFKAIPPDAGTAAVAVSPGTHGGILFSNEPALLATLAQHFPDHIPAPLAVDRERRWLLLPDVGQLLAECGVDLWEPAMRAFARLQVASIALVDDLRAADCLDRRLETLSDQIAPLLADPLCSTALGDDEWTRLRALAPRLETSCAALARFALPPTLVHGDLHAGNIGVRDDRVLIFDWTDGCIGHPFVDARMLPDSTAEFLGDPAAGDRLRAAYLEEWSVVAPLDQLREAYALAAPVVALHHAVSYRRIVANVDPVSNLDLRGGLTWALRDLLKQLEAA